LIKGLIERPKVVKQEIKIGEFELVLDDTKVQAMKTKINRWN
jgi:hypothetical protein